MSAVTRKHEISRHSWRRSTDFTKQLRRWLLRIWTECLHYRMWQQKALSAISQDKAGRPDACIFNFVQCSIVLGAGIRNKAGAGSRKNRRQEHRRASQTADIEDQRSRPARDAPTSRSPSWVSRRSIMIRSMIRSKIRIRRKPTSRARSRARPIFRVSCKARGKARAGPGPGPVPDRRTVAGFEERQRQQQLERQWQSERQRQLQCQRQQG